MTTELSKKEQPKYEHLLNDTCQIIEDARQIAYRAINNTLTIRNWYLGERIAQEELGGATRAEYGKRVIERLSDDLTARYGKGFDSSTLYRYILFYQRFPNILAAVRPESVKVAAVSPKSLIYSSLLWK